MATVFLIDPATVNPKIADEQRASYVEIADRATKDQYGRHQRTENADAADILIAPIERFGYGPFFESLKAHDLYRRHQERLFVYCPDDSQYPSLPGVYPAIAQEWVDKGWAAGGHYLSSIQIKHKFDPLPVSEKDILFSFVGSAYTHPVRDRILKLSHPQAVLRDVSAGASAPWWGRSQGEIKTFAEQYQDIVSRSIFVLCPRGVAPSSIRLFEVMESGAIPVILADEYVYPTGPKWDEFALILPEADAEQIPARIEAKRDAAEVMSAASRRAWEDFFSPQSSFHSLVEWILPLTKNEAVRRNSAVRRQVALGEYTRPDNLRAHLRKWKGVLSGG